MSIEKVKGSNVSGTPEQLFGQVAMWGVRADGTSVGYFVVKNGTTYDGAGAPYYNDTFSSALLVEECGTPDGLTPLAPDASTTLFYDLQGRRTQPAGKGLYIANGKKYIAF